MNAFALALRRLRGWVGESLVVGCLLGASGLGLAACDKSTAIDQSSDVHPDICDGYFQDCEGVGQCSTNTNIDTKHCGACGLSCGSAHGKASCIEGRCEIECSPGFTDCNGAHEDGCEVETGRDPDNCGECGHECVPIGSTVTCVESKCTILQCAVGFLDCNGEFEDGCEVYSVDNPAHCGGCGISCESPGRSGLCLQDRCDEACSEGFHACGDACVPESSADFCGDECIVCPGAPPGGERVCVNSACDFKCGDLVKCGSECVDMIDNDHHCGSCGYDCGGGACVEGKCQPALVVESPYSPRHLAASKDWLFFGDASLSRIWRVSKKGGDALEFTSAVTGVSRIMADDSRVFWESGGSLWGSGAEAFVPFLIRDGVISWTVHGGSVFYVRPNDPKSCCTDSQVGSVMKFDAGTASESLLFDGIVGDRPYSSISVGKSGVFLARGGSFCGGTPQGFELLWVQDEGKTETIYSGYAQKSDFISEAAMIRSGDKFLFANAASNASCSSNSFAITPTIARFVVGGTPKSLHSAGYTSALFLKDVVSVGNADWILGGNLLFRVPSDGEFKVKSWTLANVQDIAADEQFLYYIDSSKASILRLAP